MESTAGRGAECKIQTPFQHFEQSVNGLVSGLRGICAGISGIYLFLKTHKLPFDGKSRHFAEFLPVRTFSARTFLRFQKNPQFPQSVFYPLIGFLIGGANGMQMDTAC